MGEGHPGDRAARASADMNLPGDKGAVSIMTVHKAKGLEFSVVFLPGMNQQPLSLKKGPPMLIEEAGGGCRCPGRQPADPPMPGCGCASRESCSRSSSDCSMSP